ncbi:isoprenylcysteine carboxylmethyltransferase family protein [Lacrimispora sp. NSJ-141]|uniref:Isoprenylcysteine carboxylmethyltransferase family protein n=2 Tax=Lientehia hominis TaxID=2897778 RepID=A0AAP2W836_9FIRM|nr:isoprenylcysteine carboxylmethyltransferase family protein [Lientehia hominis]MCD2491725.1 isoprenylcysteine carboxylmethyltransferase family protein [Lientehia hominis]
MSGFFLLIPFFLIRFGLLSHLGRGAVKRAAYFPPVAGNEKTAYWIYQTSNVAIFVYLCFLTVNMDFFSLFAAGAAVYILGLLFCVISMINYASPSVSGLNSSGLYRFSRNPMYVSYFLFFSGCVLLTKSLLLGGIVLVFIISTHWIILSEERWCSEKFGESYEQYRKKVRRYL